MADYTGLDEATLNEKLNEATEYEERAAIRKALRALKKEQGRPVGRATQRAATYNRFAGTSATASKSTTPKSYIAKDGSSAAQSPARGPTPTRYTPTYSPVPVSSPLSRTPPSRQEPTPPPEEHGDDETDGIPPHTEEPEPPASPEVPSEALQRPSSPSPPPSPSPVEKFQEEEVDGAEEEEEKDEREEEQQPDEVEEEDEKEAEPEEEEPEEEVKENGADERPEPEEEEEKEEEEEVLPEPKQEEEKEDEAEKEEEKPHPPSVKSKSTPTEDSDGSPFGARLRSKRPEVRNERQRETGGGARPEFQGFKLRKTLSQDQKSSSPRGTGGGGVNFGVKLKSRPSPSTTDALPSKTQQQEPTPIRSRAKTFGGPRPSPSSSSSSSSSGPRTLRDYQQLSSRNQRSKVKSPDEDSEGGSTLPVDELQRYLVAYANQELDLSPSIPSRGKALYDVCSNPTNLCKLINKSVRNTVDLRALTTVSSNMSLGDREEANQDNMTLTIESARAIGCRVTDSTGDLILGKDPPTIRGFLIDLIRARVVHLPGMDDEPASTFSNLSLLFAKLGISEGVDGEGGENGEEEEEGGGGGGGGGRNWREMEPDEVKGSLDTPPKSPSTGSWRDVEKPSSPVARPSSSELTYEERAAQRRAERERREQEQSARGSSGDTSNLTYEERAAIRKAERERRRKERAELASH